MTDSLTKEQRSWNMSRIRSSNTKPEKLVRKILYKMGYRFRLHRKDLSGKPDITLSKYQSIIFVHGCFWHRHKNCRYAYNPKSRVDFWQVKFKQNVDRDKKNVRTLKEQGWNVLIIWECELSDLPQLENKINLFLSDAHKQSQ